MKKKVNEMIFEMLHPGVDHSNIMIARRDLPSHMMFEVAYFINNALSAKVFDYDVIFSESCRLYDEDNADKYGIEDYSNIIKNGGYDEKNMSDMDWANFASGYGKQSCKESVETLYGDLFDTVDKFINYARDNTSIIRQINPAIIEQVKINAKNMNTDLAYKWAESYRKCFSLEDSNPRTYKYWETQLENLSIYCDYDDESLNDESIMDDISKESNIKNVYSKYGVRVYSQIYLHYYTIELLAKAVYQLIVHSLEYIQIIQKSLGINAQQLVTPITPIQLVQPTGNRVNYTGNVEPINVQNVAVNTNTNTQNVAASPANPIPMDMYNALDDNAKNALVMVLNNPQLRADLEQMGNLLGWNKLLAN